MQRRGRWVGLMRTDARTRHSRPSSKVALRRRGQRSPLSWKVKVDFTWRTARSRRRRQWIQTPSCNVSEEQLPWFGTKNNRRSCSPCWNRKLERLIVEHEGS
eukprot:PhF_6_TR12911/c0_g1_i1/m.20350